MLFCFFIIYKFSAAFIETANKSVAMVLATSNVNGRALSLIIFLTLFHVNKIKSGISNTTVPIINKTDFLKIQISVTLNEKEQQKIANFLSGIDDLISTQTDRIEALKQHKKALMQGLFPVAEEV